MNFDKRYLSKDQSAGRQSPRSSPMKRWLLAKFLWLTTHPIPNSGFAFRAAVERIVAAIAYDIISAIGIMSPSPCP